MTGDPTLSDPLNLQNAFSWDALPLADCLGRAFLEPSRESGLATSSGNREGNSGGQVIAHDAEAKASLHDKSSETLEDRIKFRFHSAAVQNPSSEAETAELETLGKRLLWARARAQKSQQQVADLFEIKPQAVSQWERDLTVPSIERLERTAEFLGVDVNWIRTGAGRIFAPARVEPRVPLRGSPEAVVTTLSELPRDLPVYGTAACGDGSEADFQFNGQVVDKLRRPPGLAGVPKAFAVYAIGESMSPRYEEGDPAFVHPGRPVRAGRDVLIEFKPTKDGEPGRATIKRLVAKSFDQLRVRQFNPPLEFTIQADEVLNVYAILTAAELFNG